MRFVQQMGLIFSAIYDSRRAKFRNCTRGGNRKGGWNFRARNHFLGSIPAVVAVVAFSPVILAPTAPQPGAAKAQAAPTPDLSGIWSTKEVTFGFTKEEPAMQPWAEAQYRAARKGVQDPKDKGRDEMDPNLSCFPPGPTLILTIPRPFEIVPISGRVLLLYEWDHWVRQIWMEGRPHPKDLDPTWMGHSIGRWDGDTLVVDTIGIRDKTWLDLLGHPHSDALHLVERYRRVDQDTLLVDLTFDDPKAYTKPWKGQYLFKLRPSWVIEEQVICEDHLLDHVAPYGHSQ